MGSICSKFKQTTESVDYSQLSPIEKDTDPSRFISSEQVLEIMGKKLSGTIPCAFSLDNNGRISYKYNFFENTDEIFKNLKATAKTKDNNFTNSYDSEQERQNKLDFAFQFGYFGNNKKEEEQSYVDDPNMKESFKNEYNASNKHKGKIYTQIYTRATIVTPRISSMKINPDIEEEAEDILFGNYGKLSKGERYIRYQEFLQKYGEKIPLTYIIGAKIDLSFETNEYKDFSGTENKAKFLFRSVNFNSNFLDEFRSQNTDSSLSYSSKGFKGSGNDLEKSFSLLDKNYYDIIDVDDFHDPHEFFSKDLKYKVENWMNSIDKKSIYKLKLKRKLNLLLENVSYKENPSSDTGKNVSKWEFGANIDDLKRMGILALDKTFQREKSTKTKAKAGIGAGINIGVGLANIAIGLVSPVNMAMGIGNLAIGITTAIKGDREIIEINEDFSDYYPKKMVVVGYSIKYEKIDKKFQWSREYKNIGSNSFNLTLDFGRLANEECTVTVYFTEDVRDFDY